MRTVTDYDDLPPPRSSEDEPWPAAGTKTFSDSGWKERSDWPKISIVTPSFNQSRWLEKTIRSVLLQGYPNLEYIVIDGGSSDDSVDIIRKYDSWITHWVSEADRGQSHAINKGFAMATGEIFAWLNSDDYYSAWAFDSVVRAWLDPQPKRGAIVGDGQILDSTGGVWYQPPVHVVDKASIFRWLDHMNFMQPSCFFSDEAWKNCGPLDESVHIALDVDLWLNMAERYEFQRIDSLLSYSLKHGDAKTTRLEQLMYVDLAFVYIKHGNEVAARVVLEKLAHLASNTERELEALQNRPLGRLDQKVLKLWQRFFQRPGDSGDSIR
ncbi:glycosyltransferase family 2 protein [Elongatibacter sediminis]|uniref:Glycosyltransferase family 2 protein n=1 Tax=Elongatibacter sediminis TaxID=3119006 RepID=A0AAW9R753_9GAMM